MGKDANTSSSFTNLVIHVGPEKTGSSSIQFNLQVNPYWMRSSYKYIGKKEVQRAPRPTIPKSRIFYLFVRLIATTLTGQL